MFGKDTFSKVFLRLLRFMMLKVSKSSMYLRIVTGPKRIHPAVIALGLFLILAISTAAGLSAQEPNKAAVVVRLGEEQVTSLCVSFSEESLSGMDLLRRSGLAVENKVEGMGSLVCSIENTGCPADDCFCQCSGGDECTYWSYWRYQEEGWTYARVGATQTKVGNGGIDGWSWGPGSVTDAVAPPSVTFDQICTQDNEAQMAVAPEAIEGPDWQPYAVFGVVLLLLGGIMVITRRKRTL